MHKIFKIIIAILGGVEVVFSIFIPVAIALMFLSYADLTVFQTYLIFTLAGLSSLYRGIRFLII